MSYKNPFKILFNILLPLFIVSYGFSAPNFPSLIGYVNDEANLLNNTQEQHLTQILQHHEQNSSNQIVIVTINSLQGYDIADYGYQLGRAWGIGDKEKDNGVLLIVAPNEKKVRIEVGYGLEGALPDATANHIIQNKIIPHFKSNNYSKGILSGVNAIIQAIKGEYQADTTKNKGAAVEDILAPILFLLFFLLNFLPRAIKTNRIGSSIFFSIFAGIIVFLITHEIIFAVMAAIAVFIFNSTFKKGGDSSGSGGHYTSSGSWNSSSSSSSWGGGFSGGGGSFGGGGASGGW